MKRPAVRVPTTGANPRSCPRAAQAAITIQPKHLPIAMHRPDLLGVITEQYRQPDDLRSAPPTAHTSSRHMAGRWPDFSPDWRREGSGPPWPCSPRLAPCCRRRSAEPWIAPANGVEFTGPENFKPGSPHSAWQFPAWPTSRRSWQERLPVVLGAPGCRRPDC